MTVIITIGPSRAIQDRAHHLEAAIDRRSSHARGHPIRNKPFQCAVMDSMHLKVSNIRRQQADMPRDDIDASLQKVEELGGKKIMGPMSVGAGQIAVVQDPQGAVFALYAGQFED